MVNMFAFDLDHSDDLSDVDLVHSRQMYIPQCVSLTLATPLGALRCHSALIVDRSCCTRHHRWTRHYSTKLAR